jgi:hypothetical protein
MNRPEFSRYFAAYKFMFLKVSTRSAAVFPKASAWQLRWMRTSFIFLLVALSLTIHPSAHSTVEKSFDPPAGLEAISTPRLVGQHLFKFFGLEIYHISLWSSPEWMPEKWNQHPFALSLVYSRNLSGEDIAKRSIVEIKKQRVISNDMAQQWLSQLSALIPSVKPGDRLTGVYQPSGDLVFWMGSKKLGTIKDAALSEAFMGIWISTKTSEPKMREKLLGMLLE